MAVYVYIRCSHLDSTTSGLGLEAQERSAKGYVRMAHERGLIDEKITQILREKTVSAYKVPLFHRPVGQKLIQLLKPGDHIVFGRMDRAFRNVRDFTSVVPAWLQRNITPHFADKMMDLGSATGRLMAHMLVAVAEWESAIKSERTREALAVKRAQGLRTNKDIPAHCKLVHRGGKAYVVQDPVKRSIGQEVVRLRDEEGKSFMQIEEIIERHMAEHDERPYVKRSAWHKRQFSHQTLRKLYSREKALQEQERAAAAATQAAASTATPGTSTCSASPSPR